MVDRNSRSAREEPSLEKIIVSDKILIESYEKLMPYQPDEAQVLIFGDYVGYGAWNATDVLDITKQGKSSAGGTSWAVDGRIGAKYKAQGKRFVGWFHSHPPGHAYVSDTDFYSERTFRRWNALFASITPEGIISFFGNPNYEVRGYGVRKIGKDPIFNRYNQYQLNINGTRAGQIRFEPLNETDIEEQASRIRFEDI